jgi:hypothetical protein
MTIGSNIFGRSGIFRSAIFGGAGGAPPAVPWYLSGGIVAANCIVAYTPKGAASYAASKDNNAAPGNGLPDGTYDATDGATAPAWDAVNAWQFSDTTNRVRSPGYAMANTWTIICHYKRTGTPVNNNARMWAQTAGLETALYAHKLQYVVGSAFTPALAIPGIGVIANFCTAGGNCYRNGAPEAVVVPGAVTSVGLDIGNLSSGLRPIVGNVYAFAVYNVTITAPQVAAVAAAMALL